MSRPDATESQSEELDFEQELATVERSLQALKQRYSQVQQDQAMQAELHARQDSLNQQLKRQPSPEIKAELKQIAEQLAELEVNLESRLFTWDSLKESFWQIIRFGGLGLVLGWGLAFAVFQSPKSDTPVPSPTPSPTALPSP